MEILQKMNSIGKYTSSISIPIYTIGGMVNLNFDLKISIYVFEIYARYEL